MKQGLSLRNTQIDDYYYNEAIKTLRTNLQFSGNGLRTIMFTSCMPGEGKSDTVFALAVSLASIGKKVLLIDADIRKSVLMQTRRIQKNTNGLSQYLSGQKTTEDILYSTNVENLDLILAGPYSPNPAELLEEPLMKELLTELQDIYDYILIDTPPIGSVIDGAIIAALCDGAVLVLESENVSYRMAQKVKNQLERSGCRILGTVLNKVKLHGSGYYSKYKKYYGKYYGPEEKKSGKERTARS